MYCLCSQIERMLVSWDTCYGVMISFRPLVRLRHNVLPWLKQARCTPQGPRIWTPSPLVPPYCWGTWQWLKQGQLTLKTKVTKNRHCCIFLYFIIWCIEKIICNEYYISASHGFSFTAIGRFGISLISSAICIKLDVGTK